VRSVVVLWSWTWPPNNTWAGGVGHGSGRSGGVSHFGLCLALCRRGRGSHRAGGNGIDTYDDGLLSLENRLNPFQPLQNQLERLTVGQAWRWEHIFERVAPNSTPKYGAGADKASAPGPGHGPGVGAARSRDATRGGDEPNMGRMDGDMLASPRLGVSPAPATVANGTWRGGRCS